MNRSKIKRILFLYAIYHFTILSSASSQEVDSLLHQGWDAYKIADYDEAIRHYEQALEIDPKNCNALNNLVASYIRSGRYEYALDASKRMLRSCDKDAAYFGIAESFFKMGFRDSTYFYFDKLLALDPTRNDDVFNFLGNEYMGTEDTTPLDALLYLYKLNPDDFRVNQEIFQRYLRRGRLFRACYYYGRYLRVVKRRSRLYEESN